MENAVQLSKLKILSYKPLIYISSLLGYVFLSHWTKTSLFSRFFSRIGHRIL